MPGRPKHNERCENAERPKCRCTGCGGSRHGWQGAINIASDASGERLAKLVDATDKGWCAALRPRNKRTFPNGEPRPPIRSEQQAAIESARADVVAWLHRSPDRLAELKKAGEPFDWERNDDVREFVETHVVPALEHKFGPERVKQFQAHAVATHFWCELLAQIARVLSELKENYEKAKEEVKTALTSGVMNTLPTWELLQPYEDMIKASVDVVWRSVEQAPRAVGLPGPEDLFELIWPIRVLALLMCKDPSEHPAVREHCLNPVMRWGEVRMREEVKARLRWSFPEEWLPPTNTP
ncbi:hypothetical protein [Actinomadura harenae]|uniref:Uncharacterized protein n=1 Tax=Actinomadura harenae TaxID=2483351 RepID=A0A3M2LN56_9ACTN|nr:hypothetical protein [Actinomadura harenae]RMI38891.1 hypothetical protein EBO15_31440 [Actinomadura harenae]